MNFFNNPEYNSIKILLVVIVVAAAGYFAFTYMHGDTLGGKGQVITATTVKSTPAPIMNCYGIKDNGAGNCTISPADCGASSITGTWGTCHSSDGDSPCCCPFGGGGCYTSDDVVVTGSGVGSTNSLSSAAAAKLATYKAGNTSGKTSSGSNGSTQSTKVTN